jgi:hypothetical protein
LIFFSAFRDPNDLLCIGQHSKVDSDIHPHIPRSNYNHPTSFWAFAQGSAAAGLKNTPNDPVLVAFVAGSLKQ